MKSYKVGCFVLLFCTGLAAQSASQFVPLNPCRITDTRVASGGPGPIPANQANPFYIRTLANANCGLDLSAATAYSLNVTLVPENGDPVHFMTIWSDDTNIPPLASLMNSYDGRTKANATLVQAGQSDGGINIEVTNPTDVVLDITGYFVAPAANTLAFYSLPPCRIVDTRDANMPEGFGPPAMTEDETRIFHLMASPCLQVPGMVKPIAFSLNFTVVPSPEGSPLNYLTVWPADLQEMPLVSTLNNPTATNVANAALIRGGLSSANQYGYISVYTTNSTELVVDINGYFAPPVTAAAASFFPTVPCRVMDTRGNNLGAPFTGVLPVDVKDSLACPNLGGSTAVGYAFNTTVVPSPGFYYLTMYPNGLESPPVVSTLDAVDGFITSNMAIVPTTNGSINAFASGSTEMILDVYGYFAPTGLP
jgi:hypothetical protein